MVALALVRLAFVIVNAARLNPHPVRLRRGLIAPLALPPVAWVWLRLVWRLFGLVAPEETLVPLVQSCATRVLGVAPLKSESPQAAAPLVPLDVLVGLLGLLLVLLVVHQPLAQLRTEVEPAVALRAIVPVQNFQEYEPLDGPVE